MSNEVINEVARATPPVIVTGLNFLGVSLADWLLILTFVYTAAQFHFLLKEKSPMYRKVYYRCINFLLRRTNGTNS